MKTHFFSILLILLPAFVAAQNSLERKREKQPMEQNTKERDAFKQKIRVHKIAFFSEKLSLTSEEAEKFWPLYNTYFDKRENLLHAFFKQTRCQDCGCVKMRECEFDISKLSDEEVRKLVEEKTLLIELDKRFHADLCGLFTARRVLAFYDAEREFQRELISKLDNHKRKRPSNNPKSKARD